MNFLINIFLETTNIDNEIQNIDLSDSSNEELT